MSYLCRNYYLLLWNFLIYCLNVCSFYIQIQIRALMWLIKIIVTHLIPLLACQKVYLFFLIDQIVLPYFHTIAFLIDDLRKSQLDFENVTIWVYLIFFIIAILNFKPLLVLLWVFLIFLQIQYWSFLGTWHCSILYNFESNYLPNDHWTRLVPFYYIIYIIFSQVIRYQTYQLINQKSS